MTWIPQRRPLIVRIVREAGGWTVCFYAWQRYRGVWKRRWGSWSPTLRDAIAVFRELAPRMPGRHD